jgi:hypothetical protein
MISLHADHVDASGAYGQKFAVVEELVNKGMLTEVPEEFRDTGDTIQENVPVITTSQTIVDEEFDMTNGHADHFDETGRYARAYEEKFGAGSLDQSSDEEPQQQGQQAGSSWKSFLQKIIAEEKSKLKV